MMTRTLAAMAAALVIGAAAPAGAQVVDWNDYWELRENPPTAADAWELIEKATSSDSIEIRRYLDRSRQARKVSAYLRSDSYSKANRDALAHGLADLIVADTSAEVRGHAAAALAGAARHRGPTGKVRHRASYEALQRVFAALEPPPLCERSEWENHMPLRPGEPGYRPPCERNPLRTAWCVAGNALHGPEVSKAMGGVKSTWYPAPDDPTEVEGLSEPAARWWGRCWDGRHPGEG